MLGLGVLFMLGGLAYGGLVFMAGAEDKSGCFATFAMLGFGGFLIGLSLVV